MTTLDDLIEKSNDTFYDVVSWLAPWFNRYVIVEGITDNGVLACRGKTYGFGVEIYHPGEEYYSGKILDQWSVVLHGISLTIFNLSDPNCLNQILETLNNAGQIG